MANQGEKLSLRRIVNDRPQRRVILPRHIIISPIYNFFVDEFPHEANLERSSYKYSQYRIEKYFGIQLQQKDMPYHYWVEFVDKDYSISLGAPITHRSHFLDTLTDNGCIDYNYRNAILIAFDQDIRLELPERRMFRIMAYQAIMPLMRLFKIAIDNIVLIDDIFLEGFETKIKEEKNVRKRYNLQKGVYFDNVLFRNLIKLYL